MAGLIRDCSEGLGCARKALIALGAYPNRDDVSHILQAAAIHVAGYKKHIKTANTLLRATAAPKPRAKGKAKAKA